MRSVEQFPLQGSSDPWKVHQSYLRDLVDLRARRIDDGRLIFARVAPASGSASKDLRAANRDQPLSTRG